MERKRIDVFADSFPFEIRRFVERADIYDSSCSPEARVFFVDKECGYYIKTNEKGALKNEAVLTDWFASKGMAPNVVLYTSADRDWLVTEKANGEDCTYKKYIEDPERLCDVLAETLFWLHQKDVVGCPVQNRCDSYLRTVDENYANGVFDKSFLPAKFSHFDSKKAYEFVNERKGLLKNDTLIHGDYCLPNVLLDGFKFSSFIDLGNGGVGDRHIDLFWGAWTLNFNLHTDKYRQRFFDCYGITLVDKEMIDLIGVAECFG